MGIKCKKDFSVLLSLYIKETPSHLKECLDSVFSQTCLANEVVIVEDGPLTPELLDMLNLYVEKYPEIKLVPLDKNQGLGGALNIGLNYCTNDIIARMDTDDICKPTRFERQLNFLETHPNIDVVSAWIDEFDGDIHHIVSTRKIPETHEDIYKFGKLRNPINHPVAMFRKAAVLAAGNYKKFSLFEDYYLWSRMLVNGSRFHNIQESLLYFRFSPDMFRRRGGFRYACLEAKFQWTLYQIHYISLFLLSKNLFIRFFVRILPNSFRTLIYKKMIRH